RQDAGSRHRPWTLEAQRPIRRLPGSQLSAHALQILELVAASIAGGDVPLERRPLRRLDLPVEIRHQRFVTIRRISAQNLSHNYFIFAGSLFFSGCSITPVRA